MVAQSPEITFTLAAQYAGLPPQTLRGWLDRKQITVCSDEHREEGGWRRFTLSEVVQLAIIGVIVKYKFGVAYANDIVLNKVGLALWHNGNRIDRKAMEILDLNPIRLRFGDGDRGTGMAIEFSQADLTEDIADYLTVYPVRVIRDVLHRAALFGPQGTENAWVSDALDHLKSRPKTTLTRQQISKIGEAFNVE